MRGKLFIIGLLLTVLMIFGVPAQTCDWAYPQATIDGFSTYAGSNSGQFTDIAGNAEYILQRPLGNDIPLITALLDGVNNYVIGADDDTLIAYHYDSTSGTIINYASFTMPETIYGYSNGCGLSPIGTPIIFVLSSPSWCNNAAVAVNMTAIYYDTTSEDFVYYKGLGASTYAPCTNINCKNFTTGARTGTRCYWGAFNNRLFEYNYDTDTSTSVNLGGTNRFECRWCKYLSPVFGDVDANGVDDIVMIYGDYDAGTTYEVPFSKTQATMANDDILTLGVFNQDKERVKSVAIVDVDNDGTVEMVGTYSNDENNGDSYVFSVTNTGAAIALDHEERVANSGALSNEWSYVSNALIGDYVDSMVYPNVCGAAVINDTDGTDDEVGVWCYDFTSDDILSTTFLTGNPVGLWGTGNLIAGGEISSDHPSFDMILLQAGFVDITSGTTAFFYEYDVAAPVSPVYLNSHIIIGDSTQDGNLDINMQTDGFIWSLLSSDPGNVAPTYLDSFEWGQSSQGAICFNTTRTYYARECSSSETDECNYINDVAIDTERLLVDCGNGSIVTGAYSSSAPSISCNFETLGVITIRIYIQDAVNNATFTEYDDISVQVVNDSFPVCNIPSAPAQVTPTNTSTGLSAAEQVAADNAAATMQSVGDTIFSTDPFIKTMVGVLFMIALFMAMVKRGVSHPLIYGVGLFLVATVNAMFGLFTWVAAMLVGLGSIGIGAIGAVWGNGGGS